MTRFIARVAFLSTAFAVAAAPFAQPVATLQAAQSEVVFTSKQMGVPVDGRFTAFRARVALDPRRPEGGTVEIDIDTGSATLGLAETDAELRKSNWFDAAKYPIATFRSSTLKAIGERRFEVVGALVIKGVSRKVTVPVTLAQAGAVSTATGAFAIRRSEFRLGDGEWADPSLVADEVEVRFKLVLNGLAPL